jgi:hypothetical protein
MTLLKHTDLAASVVALGAGLLAASAHTEGMGDVRRNRMRFPLRRKYQ